MSRYDRTKLNYWVWDIVHNMMVHPLLPVAHACKVVGFPKVYKFVCDMHDKTAPLMRADS